METTIGAGGANSVAVWSPLPAVAVASLCGVDGDSS